MFGLRIRKNNYKRHWGQFAWTCPVCTTKYRHDSEEASELFRIEHLHGSSEVQVEGYGDLIARAKFQSCTKIPQGRYMWRCDPCEKRKSSQPVEVGAVAFGFVLTSEDDAEASQIAFREPTKGGLAERILDHQDIHRKIVSSCNCCCAQITYGDGVTAEVALERHHDKGECTYSVMLDDVTLADQSVIHHHRGHARDGTPVRERWEYKCPRQTCTDFHLDADYSVYHFEQLSLFISEHHARYHMDPDFGFPTIVGSTRVPPNRMWKDRIIKEADRFADLIGMDRIRVRETAGHSEEDNWDTNYAAVQADAQIFGSTPDRNILPEPWLGEGIFGADIHTVTTDSIVNPDTEKKMDNTIYTMTCARCNQEFMGSVDGLNVDINNHRKRGCEVTDDGTAVTLPTIYTHVHPGSGYADRTHSYSYTCPEPDCGQQAFHSEKDYVIFWAGKHRCAVEDLVGEDADSDEKGSPDVELTGSDDVYTLFEAGGAPFSEKQIKDIRFVIEMSVVPGAGKDQVLSLITRYEALQDCLVDTKNQHDLRRLKRQLQGSPVTTNNVVNLTATIDKKYIEELVEQVRAEYDVDIAEHRALSIRAIELARMLRARADFETLRPVWNLLRTAAELLHPVLPNKSPADDGI